MCHWLKLYHLTDTHQIQVCDMTILQLFNMMLQRHQSQNPNQYPDGLMFHQSYALIPQMNPAPLTPFLVIPVQLSYGFPTLRPHVSNPPFHALANMQLALLYRIRWKHNQLRGQ